MHLLDPDLQIEDVLLRQKAGELERDLVDDGEKGRIRAGHHEALRFLDEQGREEGGTRRLEPELDDLADLLDKLPDVEGLLEEVRRSASSALRSTSSLP